MSSRTSISFAAGTFRPPPFIPNPGIFRTPEAETPTDPVAIQTITAVETVLPAVSKPAAIPEVPITSQVPTPGYIPEPNPAPLVNPNPQPTIDPNPTPDSNPQPNPVGLTAAPSVAPSPPAPTANSPAQLVGSNSAQLLSSSARSGSAVATGAASGTLTRSNTAGMVVPSSGVRRRQDMSSKGALLVGMVVWALLAEMAIA